MSSNHPDQKAISGINAAAIQDTTSTAIIAAQGTGKAVYITDIIVANDHASTGTRVDILDGVTVKASVYVNAKDSQVVPLAGVLKGTANTVWNAKPATTSSSIWCTLVGYQVNVP